MARCGCNQTCSCVVQACPDGSTSVTGNGSTANPYVICAESTTVVTALDTPCVDMTVTGDGSVGAPFEVSADPIISPAAGNGLVCLPDGLFAPGDLVVQDSDCIDLSGAGTATDPLVATPIIDPTVGNGLVCGPLGLFAPAPAAGTFVPGCGLVTDAGTGVTSTNTPEPWPFACPDTEGQDVYCGADGQLRTNPEKFTILESNDLLIAGPTTPWGNLTPTSPTPSVPVGGTVDTTVTNPSNCLPMTLRVRVCIQHMLVSLHGSGFGVDNNAQFDSTVSVAGTTTPGVGLGGHQRWRRMFDANTANERDVRDTTEACFTTTYTLAPGASATFTLGAAMTIDANGTSTVAQWINSIEILGFN